MGTFLVNGKLSVNDEIFATKSLYMGNSSMTDGPAIVFPSNKRNHIWIGYANDNGSWYIWDSHNSKGIIASDINGNNTFYGNADTATKLKTARTLTVGSTGKTFNGSADVSWTHAEIGATVSNAWSNGTSSGPKLTTTINSVASTAKAIPTATASRSGVVSTGSQTFAGAKTFNDAVTVSGSFTTKGEFEIYGANPHIDFHFNNSTADYTSRIMESSSGKININGSTFKTNAVTLPATTMSGQIKLAITGGGWYNPVVSPGTAGLLYDASSSTSSTYWPIVNLKFPNSTFSLGGERATDVFGIFRYANTRTENGYDAGFWCNGGNNYFYCSTRVYGAVWNDYAEFRNQKNEVKPGYCVASTNDGKVYKTTEHLQACDGIVSDTYGFAIGETNDCKTPLAVSGRVLAYCEGNAHDYNAGDTVGASANGKVIKMTREEIKEYPDRIVGIVSEIPEYEIWGTGNVEVDGRIWIKVK